MAKKKVRKAGMVKRQQAKKHTKAQQRRKFASRRMISNSQAATQNHSKKETKRSDGTKMVNLYSQTDEKKYKE